MCELCNFIGIKNAPFNTNEVNNINSINQIKGKLSDITVTGLDLIINNPQDKNLNIVISTITAWASSLLVVLTPTQSTVTDCSELGNMMTQFFKQPRVKELLNIMKEKERLAKELENREPTNDRVM